MKYLPLYKYELFGYNKVLIDLISIQFSEITSSYQHKFMFWNQVFIISMPSLRAEFVPSASLSRIQDFCDFSDRVKIRLSWVRSSIYINRLFHNVLDDRFWIKSEFKIIKSFYHYKLMPSTKSAVWVTFQTLF